MKMCRSIALFLIAISSSNHPFPCASADSLRGENTIFLNDEVNEIDEPAVVGSEDDETTRPVSGEEELEDDISLIAKLSGFTRREDVVRLLQQQRQFSDIVASVLQEDQLFAQTQMPLEPDGTFVIQYKGGQIPSESMATIDRFFQVDYPEASVTIESTKFSLAEAQERAQKLAESLRSQGYRQVGYSIDGDDLEILAVVPPIELTAGSAQKLGELPTEEIASIVGLDSRSEEMTNVKMIVEDDSVVLELDEHTYGGRKIYGGGRRCTTGFTVIDGTGRTGVATAAHCTG